MNSDEMIYRLVKEQPGVFRLDQVILDPMKSTKAGQFYSCLGFRVNFAELIPPFPAPILKIKLGSQRAEVTENPGPDDELLALLQPNPDIYLEQFLACQSLEEALELCLEYA